MQEGLDALRALRAAFMLPGAFALIVEVLSQVGEPQGSPGAID